MWYLIVCIALVAFCIYVSNKLQGFSWKFGSFLRSKFLFSLSFDLLFLFYFSFFVEPSDNSPMRDDEETSLGEVSSHFG